MAKFKGVTHILFVLDESGSMGSVRHDTISGFNEFMSELKKDRADQAVQFSLTKFNTSFFPVHVDIPLADVPDLTLGTYEPGGMTALYDAVAHTVKQIEGSVKKKDRALVIIMTDGEENSSKENTRQQVFDMITNHEGLGNWTFTFLGANQDSWLAGGSIGMSQGNTMNYNAAQPMMAFAAVAKSTSRYMRSASKRSLSFYDDTTNSDD